MLKQENIKKVRFANGFGIIAFISSALSLIAGGICFAVPYSDFGYFGLAIILLSVVWLALSIIYIVKKKQWANIIMVPVALALLITDIIALAVMITSVGDDATLALRVLFVVLTMICGIIGLIAVILGTANFFLNHYDKEQRQAVKRARQEEQNSMSYAKKTVTLVGAIFTVILGVVVAIDVIISFINLGNAADIINYFGLDTTFAYIILSIMIAVCLVNLIAGGFLCKVQALKPPVITLIVSNGILMILSILLLPDVFAIIELIFSIVVLGLLITGLCLRNAAASKAVNAPAAADTQLGPKESKIALLKKLKAEGSITEEDYKRLLLKELEK